MSETHCILLALIFFHELPVRGLQWTNWLRCKLYTLSLVLLSGRAHPNLGTKWRRSEFPNCWYCVLLRRIYIWRDWFYIYIISCHLPIIYLFIYLSNVFYFLLWNDTMNLSGSGPSALATNMAREQAPWGGAVAAFSISFV